MVGVHVAHVQLDVGLACEASGAERTRKRSFPGVNPTVLNQQVAFVEPLPTVLQFTENNIHTSLIQNIRFIIRFLPDTTRLSTERNTVNFS